MTRRLTVLLVWSLAAGMPIGAHAQGKTAPAAGAQADLRPAYATPQDISDGRRVAEASCTRCHGLNGISATKGVPHIAGQRPAYLYTELLAYQKGQRPDKAMSGAVRFMKDDALVQVSAYYASLEPAQPVASSGAVKPAPAKPDATSAGRAATAGCAGCHGEGGVSSNPAYPSLAGQDAQYFAAAMRAYKDGSRSDAVMKGPAASVDDNAIKDLSAYYASQQPRAPAVKKPLTTAELAQRCDRCHGVNGNSTDPRSPALAAQRADYLELAMRAYQKGERKSKAMAAMLDGLSDAEIERLAAHYAGQRARSVVYIMLPSK